MKQTSKALYQFASGYGWEAFPEYGVPKGAEFPYITYTLQEEQWDTVGMLQMRLWYKGSDYNTINEKVDEISQDIESGKEIMTDSGILYIYKGSPWCQIQPSDEKDLKIYYLNFNVNYATL